MHTIWKQTKFLNRIDTPAGTLWFKKSNLTLVGHNLNSSKNLQKQISFIYAQVPRNEPAPPHVDYHPTLQSHISQFHSLVMMTLILVTVAEDGEGGDVETEDW